MAARTILLLYVSVGQGHRKAALAIQNTLNQADSLLRIVCLDLFELWPPGVVRPVAGLYRMLLRVAPGLWTYLYDHRSIKDRLDRPLGFFHRLCRGRFHLLLEELTPAAVVCTQAFPCTLAADCKALVSSPYSLVAVPTDFRVHAYWLHEGVDLFLLPSRESFARMVGQGIDAGRVRVVGIPVHPGFSRRLDRNSLKNKYGLSTSIPTVLLMGGGEGTVSLERLILALDSRAESFQMAALSGRNIRQHAHLKRLRRRLEHPLAVFGFTDTVDELMTAVDVIVTKPGGLTIAEALVKRLPMVLIDPLPGQEELNARFLLEHGVAIRAANGVHAAEMVARLLRDDDLREKMKDEMGEIRRPDAAHQAARLIIESFPSPDYS